MRHDAEPIAIVGMAGTYAGAADRAQFWQNVLDKRDCVEDAPADWLGDFFDADSDSNDRIYSRLGGFLRGNARFNPVSFGIMPRAVDGGEPDQFLALHLAREALRDAGLLDADFDRRRAGVVLGRGTYINRGYTNLLQHGLIVDQTLNLLAQARPDLGPAELAELRRSLKAQLPPFHTEMAAGLVPNVTSGLIANRLDLMGPNYILDAACASTLIAIDHAVADLQSGRADLMITGGVQASTPPQIVMIFCQLGAISRGRLRPFSRDAGGTLLGEGAGLFVLKRLADAQRDNDRVYAVIRGIGSSSDGKAKGLLAPRPEGEELAIRRGYENAGVDPSTVELIECHGTGIPLGDATEVGSLRRVFGERTGPAPRIAIGSVKSMIAHCLPAAGSAALMKMAMALHDKVLPPTLCDEVDPALELEKTPFYVNTETRPWIHDPRTPRRAGVNAFGFGGVNAHLVVEEFLPRPERVQVAVRLPAQDRELFTLAADNRPDLVAAATALATAAEALPAADNAAFLALQQPASAGAHRACLVAENAGDLAKRARALADKLGTADAAFTTRNGSAYGHGDAPGRLAFVFPGEGAQYPGMLAGLARRFPAVRSWLDFVEGNAAADAHPRPRDVLAPAPTALNDGQRAALEARLYEMDLASESIFAASQGLFALLGACGIAPDLVLGHSTGEHAALVAAGVYGDVDAAALSALTEQLNGAFLQLQHDGAIATGALLTVGALDAATRETVLADFADSACVAIDNCPNQAVVYVDKERADTVRRALIAAGGIVAELPFDRAYHTDRFAPVTAAFRAVMADIPVQAARIPVVSCATAAAFPADADAIRDLACAQWSAPVRFRETVLQLVNDGVGAFVEVGPSGNLTAFIADTLKAAGQAGDVLAMSCNTRRQNDQATFLGLLGQLWCAGYPVDLEAVMRPESAIAADAAAKPAPALNTVLPQLRWPEGFALPAAAPGGEGKPEPQMSPMSPMLNGDRGRELGATGVSDGTADAEASSNTPTDRPEAYSVQSVQSVDLPRSSMSGHHAAPADANTAILTQHFALMQDFLAQQQRALDDFSASVSPTVGFPTSIAPAMATAAPSSTPTSPAQAAPLLLEALPQVQGDRAACDLRLDPARHLYLQDHTLGKPASRAEPQRLPLAVVPFTFSLELLAQLGVTLAPAGWVLVEAREARGHRWLALDHGVLDLRLDAQRVAQDAQRCTVRAQIDDGRSGPAFEVTLHFAPGYPPAPAVQPPVTPEPIRHNPPEALYAQGMFHGQRLQGVVGLTGWSPTAIAGTLRSLPLAHLTTAASGQGWHCDPVVLDAVGQLAGYWLSEKYNAGFNCFPYRVGALRFYAPPTPPDQTLPSTGRFREQGEDAFAVDWQ
ncbi:MAG: beta-ketoacyl synthase N-terminal-like domain-containing protein, partial [Oceanococcaceae bacterium]